MCSLSTRVAGEAEEFLPRAVRHWDKLPMCGLDIEGMGGRARKLLFGEADIANR